jgi:hypothetical protein
MFKAIRVTTDALTVAFQYEDIHIEEFSIDFKIYHYRHWANSEFSYLYGSKTTPI